MNDRPSTHSRSFLTTSPEPATPSRKPNRRTAALAGSVSVSALACAIGRLSPDPAGAACVLTSGPGTATSPGTGAVVTCNTAPPNPFTQRITAQNGSSSVRVNVLPGSIVSVSGGGGSSITVRNDSSATNDGAIVTSSTGG